jgi:hypothetical protein
MALDDRQEEYQSHMIEVEGMIDNYSIAILIDSRAIHSYIDRNMVDRFKLKRCNNEKSWLVQLANVTKRRINEILKYCAVNMDGVSNKAYLNIIPVGSYDWYGFIGQES